MPEFRSVSGGVARTVGVVAGASSLATQLTANASANTKGSAVVLIDPTEFDAHWVQIMLTGVSAQADYLVDLMIGAATEQVIIPDLYATSRAATGSFGPYLFPIFIPRGSRLTARCQCSTGGATIRISVTLISGNHLMGGSGPSWVSSYGATASSLGTNIDPGGVANTDSAWTQMTASTDRAHNWLVLAGRYGDGAVLATTHWRVSIGIGAATETVLVPDIHLSAETTGDLAVAPVIWVPCFVPAASRLTVKVRSSVATDGDRDIWVRLYGAG